ncbi:hypothetical protein [Lacinutrix undariae]
MSYTNNSSHKKYIHLFLLYLFFGTTYISFSQTLTGIVKDSTHVLPNITILIKRHNTSEILQYTSTDNNGKYTLKLNHSKDSLFVEFNSFLYQSQKKQLANFTIKNDSIKVDVTLKEQVNILDNVVIRTEKRITVKKDTTVYNVEKHKDGTEKTVEDLLKKLPGIKVSNDGTISYKGKSIKKLLLDGDDLFGANYTVGSKNINIDIIDKIEGIDNYDDNELKKGLRDTEDVALNLILKEGKIDLSGNASLGYAYKEYYDAHLVGIVINKKAKLLNVISANNIGNSESYTFKENIDKAATKLINEGNIYSLLDESYHNFNNNITNNSNILFKLFKKSNLRLNLNGQIDALKRTNYSSTTLNSDTDNGVLIETSDKLRKKPLFFNANINFENKETDSLHWNYTGNYNYKNINTTDFSDNNSFLQNSNLDSKSTLIENQLNLTYRLNQNTALESVLNYSYSEAPQVLNISPNTELINNNAITPLNQQTSTYKKNNISFKTDLVGLHNKNQYKIEAGYQLTHNNFNSLLQNSQTQNTTENTFTNRNTYHIERYFLNSGYRLKFHRYTIDVGTKLQYNNLTLKDESSANYTAEKKLIALPYMKHHYSFSRKMSLQLAYNYNENLPKNDYLFTNFVQTDYRSFKTNTISLDNLKSHNANINLKYYDFYNKHILNIGGFYTRNQNNYFYDNEINNITSITNTFLKTINLNSYNLYLNAETYSIFLNSTIQINTSYGISQNISVLNNSNFRNILINDLQLEYVNRTKFKTLINFENKFTYNNVTYKTDVSYTANSITNQLKTIIKINDAININALYIYILPDVSQQINYNFIEAQASYKPKNSNLSYTILAKNLMNEKEFKTLNVNDYSTSRSSYNLIERYIMFKATFYF